jgi:PilZ domain
MTTGKKDEYSNTFVRRDARHPQFSELSVSYEGTSEDMVLHTPDLSVHGMFISTAKEFAEGSVLKLRFRLTRTGVVVQTRCEVRYCLAGVGVGVEFLDISQESVRAIENEIGVVAAGE